MYNKDHYRINLPTHVKHELTTCFEWLTEEANEGTEAGKSSDSSELVDALFDSLGILGIGIHLTPQRELIEGFHNYQKEQQERGRDINTFHMYIIALILEAKKQHSVHFEEHSSSAILDRKRKG